MKNSITHAHLKKKLQFIKLENKLVFIRDKIELPKDYYLYMNLDNYIFWTLI